MSIRAYAAHLGVSVASVSNWESRGERIRLRDETMQILDTDLRHASDDVRGRFEAVLGQPAADRNNGDASTRANGIERRHGIVGGQPGRREDVAPEGAFLGDGSVIIATPLKQEAINSRPVVAAEDVVGAQLLGELAARLGLAVGYETVPLGGDIDLNRPNLLLICGPRLSPMAAAVLSQDRHLSFVTAEDGPWTLRDNRTGRTYRSGLDQSPRRPWDVAYLGRLPRLDGKGSVLIFTGIHPQGSLGVARLIINQIGRLHNEIGQRHFSMLIGVDFLPETGEATRVERITPTYRQEAGRATG